MSKYELVSFANAQALARSAAKAWLDEMEAARRVGEVRSVVLSGGRIAAIFFAAAAAEARARNLAVDNVHFFWADERCVPPDNSESNFALANRPFLQPLGLPAAHIHRIRGECDPEQAARMAANELRGIAPQNFTGQPVLDLIFLGMGEDGHVASLFPGSQIAILHSTAVYETVVAPKPPPRRITLTYEVIFAAREVWVMVSGEAKERALEMSLLTAAETPLATVIHGRAHTRVLTDVRPQTALG